MPKLSIKEIQKRAIAIISESPGGIRYSPLRAKISSESPETPGNTIHAAIRTLKPPQVIKPSRGLYKAAGGSGDDSVVVGDTEQVAPTGVKVYEHEFYEPFAQWLKDDLDEVTVVAALGGSIMESKWGTPGEPEHRYGSRASPPESPAASASPSSPPRSSAPTPPQRPTLPSTPPPPVSSSSPPNKILRLSYRPASAPLIPFN